MRQRGWTKKQLKVAVKKSPSFRQVLCRLGLKPAGGNYSQVKKYIQEYNFDIAHFKGKAWNRGLRHPFKPKIPLEKILTHNSLFQSYKLKQRLFIAGLKPKHCEECGWCKQTSDGYLPLELDHINGNPYDNRLENLRILCPNCHSLKPTHRGRRKGNSARVVKRQTHNT